MRIIEPARYKKQSEHPKRRKRLGLKLVLMAVVLLVASGANVFASLTYPAAVEAQTYALKIPASEPVSLPWPAYGQAAIGAVGYDVLAVNGDQVQRPTASVAKIITALAVLKKNPLKSGEHGPNILISADDVASYREFLAQGGSVFPVNLGQQINQYDALQALLLPSGNNIGYTLARWSFGSVEAYIAYANDMVVNMGLSSTRVADASGFSPDTVSTARDLVLLGQAALKNPVLAEIVAKRSAALPGVGEVQNVNWLLGEGEVNGIKTGYTEAAGGCYLFSSPFVAENGETVTVVGAIMGAPNRNIAISDSRPIIKAAKTNFEAVTITSKGQAVGIYHAGWAAPSSAIARDELKLMNWKGSAVIAKILLQPVEAPASVGAPAGQITASAGAITKGIQVVLESPIPEPSYWWRVQHRFSNTSRSESEELLHGLAGAI